MSEQSTLAIYPGSFDPITNGHIDIIRRACQIFDKVIVAVAQNISKKPLFSEQERAAMVQEVVKDFPQVTVDSFAGLLVHYAEQKGATAIIRGLRAMSDFEYEFQMAMVNRKLSDKLLTVFLMPHEKYSYLNSSIVKELAKFGGEISCFVPPFVEQQLAKKMREK
jgi:pantetheine-phosphate adenylyltransferase